MKKSLIILLAVPLAAIAWVGFNWFTLPAPPLILRNISPEIDLEFTINKVGGTEIELSLNGESGANAYFTHFTMSDGWTKGQPGLVLSSMGNTSKMRNRGVGAGAYLNEKKQDPKKDFSKFMKDDRGKVVNTYVFNQVLSEGQDGKLYMKIAYKGPRMPLLQTLKLDRPLLVPQHISKKFTDKGQLQFNAGTVYLDKKTNGFWIPVEIK